MKNNLIQVISYIFRVAKSILLVSQYYWFRIDALKILCNIVYKSLFLKQMLSSFTLYCQVTMIVMT